MKTAIIVFTLIFLLFPSITIAGTAIQTDWSGGYGYPGPVTDWVDPSDIFLSPLEHIVPGDINNATAVCAADIDSESKPGFQELEVADKHNGFRDRN